MINIARLTTELQGQLPIVTGCGIVSEQFATMSPSTYYTRPEGMVQVNWSAAPSAAQQTTASTIVQAHDGTPTVVEKLDGIGLPMRVLAALTLRQSASWATLTPAHQSAVQALIDSAGSQIKTSLGW